MLGIYHSADLDGHCTGAIFKKAYPDIELMGWNYGDPLPDVSGHDVVLVGDVSFDWGFMKLLRDKHGLVWIDHHKTAIEQAKEHGISTSYTDVTRAACEIAWAVLIGGTHPAVTMLGRYDTWQHNDDPSILDFQMGCKAHETDPAENFEFWGELFGNEHFTEIILDEGNTVRRYTTIRNAKQLKSCVRIIDHFGLRLAVCNAFATGSKLFDSLTEPVDAVSTYWQRSDGKWTVSLYSTTTDISEICKSMGGGGHKGAGGFITDEVPYA